MKTKIISIVIVLLITSVFIGNYILGNKIAKDMDVELKSKIDKNELPVSIIYSDVKVNPLFSTVKLVGVTITDLDEDVIFNCKVIEIDIPYKEAIRLAESNEFEELNALGVTFKRPEVRSLDKELIVKLDELTIDFDGHLTQEQLQNIQNKFPDEQQELAFSFLGLKVNLPEEYSKIPLFSDLQKQFLELDKGSYTLVFLPEKKQFNIKEFSISSPVFSYKGKTLFSYEGNGFNDFKAKTALVESELLSKSVDFEWEDENGKGEFSLGKLAFETNTQVSFNNMTLPDGEFILAVEKLKIKYGEDKMNSGGASPFNLSLNNIDLEKLSLHYKLEDEILSITDTEIRSSLLDATVFANVQIDLANPANSTINEAKVEVMKLSPDLESTLSDFEQQMGKELPRENGVIILELSGKLASPKIKDFEF